MQPVLLIFGQGHGQRLVHDDHAQLLRRGASQPRSDALDLRGRELPVLMALPARGVDRDGQAVGRLETGSNSAPNASR